MNLFHGRIDEGRAFINATPGAALAGKRSGDDVVYVRPHWLEIGGNPTEGTHFRATIRHINSARPLVKVVRTGVGAAFRVHVEMSQERFRDLQLKKDEAVFITPKDAKVFLNDAS